MKDASDPVVLAWTQDLAPADLTTCVVTVEEIERGLARLPGGRRRRDLERRWTQLVDSFAEAVVVHDLPAAREAAAILVAAHVGGRPDVPGRCADCRDLCRRRP